MMMNVGRSTGPGNRSRRLHHSQINLRRMPSFCASLIGALLSFAGVVAITFALGDEGNKGHRMTGYVLLGVGIPFLVIGVISHVILYKDWQHKKRAQKERRKKMEAQSQLKYAVPYVISAGIYGENDVTCGNDSVIMGEVGMPGGAIIVPPPYEELPPPYRVI